MARHWVQTQTVIRRYDEGGATKLYNPGDWFEVRNQELLQLQALGQIRTTAEALKATFDFSQCGILWRGSLTSLDAPRLQEYGIATEESATLALPWKYTLLGHPPAVLTAQNIALGFVRIEDGKDWDAWEMAACLADGLPLAQAHGSDAEKQRTLDVVGDLRIPLYNTTMLWVRRTDTTAALIADWEAELNAGADERHAFARALYTRRVRMCTLPPNWVGAAPGPL